MAASVLAAGRVAVAVMPEGVMGIGDRTGATAWTHDVRRSRQELALAPGHRVVVLDTDVVPHLGD